MSASPSFWYHCGRCGSLFRAKPGTAGESRCAHCGADPGTGMVNPPPPVVSERGNQVEEANKGQAAGRGKRAVRKHRNRYMMLKLIVGWSLVLWLIVFGARRIWPEPTHSEETAVADHEEAAPALAGEDLLLFQDAVPLCNELFAQFLAAGTPEARNQFVFSPITTAARMAQFYNSNPIPQIDPASLELTAGTLLNLPGEKACIAHWKCGDGRVFDAVFRQENGEWRLDWEHFARYSDHPWPLFLAGTGPEEGEFRLLARERLAEERKGEDAISLVLYAPRFGSPGEVGSQSPEFLVSRKDPKGRLLDAAFKLARSGGTVFGDTLPNIDPEEMIRVRVKVRRSDGKEGRLFEITSVIACHWLSLNDPGVKPEEAAPMQPQEAR